VCGLTSITKRKSFEMLEANGSFLPITCGSICDFCSSREVFQVFMAENFTAAQLAAPDGLPVYLNSTGGWAACRDCARLVETAQWDELLERCFDTFKASLPASVHLSMVEEQELKGILRSAHEQFRQMRKRTV
jgi:hypothetical protein